MKKVVRIAEMELEFARCPAGAFVMGSDKGLPLETPPHPVQIEDEFWMCTVPVTQELWQRVMGNNPAAFRSAENLPVDSVSHDDAVAFCQSVSRSSDLPLTLPTEAQWEYSCRAGTTTEYFWGESPSDARDFAWFDVNAGERTREVGQLTPNPWGLYDVVGNVWEWCQDVWHSDYTGAITNANQLVELAQKQPRRSLRGGAWDMDTFRLRSAYRSCDHHDFATSRFGLRLCLTE